MEAKPGPPALKRCVWGKVGCCQNKFYISPTNFENKSWLKIYGKPAGNDHHITINCIHCPTHFPPCHQVSNIDQVAGEIVTMGKKSQGFQKETDGSGRSYCAQKRGHCPRTCPLGCMVWTPCQLMTKSLRKCQS